MTIFNTAYNTTVLNGAITGKIVSAIEEAKIREYIRSADSVLLIESVKGASSAIPQFLHPIYVGKQDPELLQANRSHWTDSFLAVDLRPAGYYDDVKDEFVVRNATIYKTRLYRAGLNAVWLTQGPGAVKNLTSMAASVFASWLSEAISSRYGLDPGAKVKLMILSAIFYMSNHEAGEIDKLRENRFLASIANSLGVDMGMVQTIYDVTGLVNNANDYCEKARDLLNNVRLQEFNSAVLITLVGKTWYGENAPEMTASALEHPPTWLALLLEAYTDTAMRKTTIAKICERRAHKDGLEMLVRAVKALLPEISARCAKYK